MVSAVDVSLHTESSLRCVFWMHIIDRCYIFYAPIFCCVVCVIVTYFQNKSDISDKFSMHDKVKETVIVYAVYHAE